MPKEGTVAKRGPRVSRPAVLSTDEVNRLIDEARDEGRRIGREETRVKYNDYLQAKYYDSKIEKGTPEAEAILAVVRDLNKAYTEGVL